MCLLARFHYHDGTTTRLNRKSLNPTIRQNLPHSNPLSRERGQCRPHIAPTYRSTSPSTTGRVRGKESSKHVGPPSLPGTADDRGANRSGPWRFAARRPGRARPLRSWWSGTARTVARQISALGPAPLSQTRTRTRSAASPASSMRTQPPGPAASMALSTRFISSCRSCSASASNCRLPASLSTSSCTLRCRQAGSTSRTSSSTIAPRSQSARCGA